MNNRIPPPVIGIVTAILMWYMADHLHWGSYTLDSRLWISLLLGTMGVVMALTGVVMFKLAKTTTNPLSPDKASVLVSHGIYALSRNPMYMGVLVVLSGWSVYLENLLSILALPLYVWYITRFQIIPEEYALQRIFGQNFTEYQNKVRRWI